MIIKKIVLSVSLVFVCVLAMMQLNKNGEFIPAIHSISNHPIVVIDPGHGGFDPGKVGVNDELEKEINLAISLRLKEYLEEQNIQVIMTRETDVGLYSEGSKNKKREDLRNRVQLIHETAPEIVVSIHQNSFQQEGCKGAQVFYYENSEYGKLLAEYIQQSIILSVDQKNKRKVKSSTSYYMLKETKQPTVIVECGFLSNYEEAKLLSTTDYQDKMASAIHIGIMAYLENNQEENEDNQSTVE